MNCFTKQRLLSLLMVGSLMAGSMPSVLALDDYNGVKDIPGVGNSEVTLTVENTGGSGGGDTPIDPDNPDVPPVDPTIFSAYVPAELPIKMDLDGNIVVPDNAMIINAVESKGIKVSEINVALESGWSASNWNDDFAIKLDNSKELGLKLRSDYLSSDGSFSLSVDDWKIAKNSYIDLNMGAKLPKQTEAGNKGKVATISFILDWSGDDVTVGPEIPGGNPNGGGSGGGSETPPLDKVTVKFVSNENGSLEGETELVINSGDTLSFPTANPKSIRYELSNWVDTSTNNEVSETTPIVEDTTIKAVFDERAASPKNWFTTDGANTITGLSDEYLNLVDAPTDLVIPNNIGGSTIKAIGSNAFANKDLITSIVIPDTVTTLKNNAFRNCTSLSDVYFSNTLQTIGVSAFSNCTSITEFHIPSSIEYIYGLAFAGCSSADIYLPNKAIRYGENLNLKAMYRWSSYGTTHDGLQAGSTVRAPDKYNINGTYYIFGYRPFSKVKAVYVEDLKSLNYMTVLADTIYDEIPIYVNNIAQTYSKEKLVCMADTGGKKFLWLVGLDENNNQVDLSTCTANVGNSYDKFTFGSKWFGVVEKPYKLCNWLVTDLGISFS